MTYKHISKEQFKKFASNKANLSKKDWAKMINYTFLIRQGLVRGGKQKICLGSKYK